MSAHTKNFTPVSSCSKCSYTQWWEVTNYIYSNSVLKYSVELLYMSVSLFSYFSDVNYDKLIN